MSSVILLTAQSVCWHHSPQLPEIARGKQRARSKLLSPWQRSISNRSLASFSFPYSLRKLRRIYLSSGKHPCCEKSHVASPFLEFKSEWERSFSLPDIYKQDGVSDAHRPAESKWGRKEGCKIYRREKKKRSSSFQILVRASYPKLKKS